MIPEYKVRRLEHQVKLLSTSGELIEAMIYYENRPPYVIEFDCPKIAKEKFKAEAGRSDDLFECLRSLRIFLEPKGWKILCCGARVDAWASGMARQSGATKVYIIKEMGKPGTLEDLVGIFDDAPSDKIATVKEQEIFFKKWIDSLKRR